MDIGFTVTELAELCRGKAFYSASSPQVKQNVSEVVTVVLSINPHEKEYDQNCHANRSN
jgi:hypothetical protein